MNISLDDLLQDAGPLMVLTVAKYEDTMEKLGDLAEQLDYSYKSIDSLCKQVRKLEDRLDAK